MLCRTLLLLTVMFLPLAGQNPEGALYSNQLIYYKVRPGDNLWDIARKWMPYTRGWSIDELVSALVQTNRLGSSRIVENLVLAIPVKGPAPTFIASRSSETSNTRGIYLPAHLVGSTVGSNLIERFALLGGNTLIFDVKEVDGRVHFPFTNPLSDSIGSPDSTKIADLQRVIQFVHQKKLRAVARVACFADRWLFKARPEYRLRDTSYLDIQEQDRVCWVDPGNPNVTGYLLDLILALTRQYGVDEVHLDYVRFPNRPEPLLRMNLDRSREDLITQFVKDAHRVTQKSGKRLSLAVFGIVAWNQKGDTGLTGQSLPRLGPLCEGIHLMLYPSHFAPGFAGFANPADHPQALVPAAIGLLRDLTGKRNLSASPWLQAFDLDVTRYDSKYIRSSIQAATESGTGWLFWNPAGRYEEVFGAMGEAH